jgi:hypothetical protein
MFDINPAVYDALESVAVDVHAKIIEAIESDDWPWPRETYRKDKTQVPRPTGTPRDIVDLGPLRDSQKWESIDYGDGLGIRFYNDAEHSALVHEGGSNGNAEIPARPFMTRVLAELNIEQMMADELGSRLETTKSGKIRTRRPDGTFGYSRGIGDVNVQTDTNRFEGYYGGGDGDNP